MKKFRLFFDKDLEQKWLNEMSEKGWALESFCFGICTFKPCKPGEYIYQIDMLKGIGGQDYKEFLKEMNIELIQQWFRWLILRKKKAEGAFDLYTDDASLIAFYTRIRNFFKVFTIATIIFITIYTFILFQSNEIIYLLNILVFGLLAFFFIRQAIRSNIKIMKLKGRFGENEKRPFPPLIIAGFLLNSLNIVARWIWEDFFSTGHGHNISLSISIAAVLMLIAGAFIQIKKVHSNR
ncbi:MAG: DUF2812 domain-containing protein [Lachnospiraceae bacterium]|nr:DUF2812 domain-containing protein [Lachnospiraceae bacterium]